MNKKILMLTMTLIVVSMMITPLIGTAQACRWRKPRKCRTVETFTTTPFVDPITLTNMEDLETGSEKYVCDGTIRIAHGALRKFDYNGPLGTGTLYLKTLISIANVEIPYDISISTGRGTYKYTLIIDNGPYGTGTLKGIGKMEWDYDITELRFETWDTAKLVPVKGDLNIKCVSVEGYTLFFDWWWTTTTVVSHS